MNDRTASLSTHPGRRCLGWLGAVVLFVLLTTAGEAVGGQTFVGAEPVATRCDGACRGDVRRSEPAAHHVAAARTLQSARRAPRPFGRQRSVQRRGLPPPRAPTA